MKKIYTTQSSKGFTFIELILVIAIFGTLAGLITVNLLTLSTHATLSTATTTLLSDIKSQQTRAMSGDTAGTGATDSYGIKFGTTTYTLFKGTTYSQNDPSNYTVTLGNNLTFTNVLFPSNQVVFSAGNGEIKNFVPSSNSVTVLNISSNQQKTIKLNINGVITSVN